MKIIRMAWVVACLISCNSMFAKIGTACWVLNFDEAAARYQLHIVLPDNKLRGVNSLTDETLQLEWTAFSNIDIRSTTDSDLNQDIYLSEMVNVSPLEQQPQGQSNAWFLAPCSLDTHIFTASLTDNLKSVMIVDYCIQQQKTCLGIQPSTLLYYEDKPIISMFIQRKSQVRFC